METPDYRALQGLAIRRRSRLRMTTGNRGYFE